MVETTEPPFVDVNEAHRQSLAPLERVATSITNWVGSMGFFFMVAAWSAVWIGWNLLAPKEARFDPPMAFVFWLFISNLLQIMLMPLIMVGQNLQGRHAELRAENDYRVNLKAEDEIRQLTTQLEDQRRLLEEIAAQVAAIHSGQKRGRPNNKS